MAGSGNINNRVKFQLNDVSSLTLQRAFFFLFSDKVLKDEQLEYEQTVCFCFNIYRGSRLGVNYSYSMSDFTRGGSVSPFVNLTDNILTLLTGFYPSGVNYYLQVN